MLQCGSVAKLLLMSTLIATVALPIIASREKKRAQGFRKMLIWMAVFSFFYMLALIYIYPILERL